MISAWEDEQGNDFGWRCPDCKTTKRLSVVAELYVQCVKSGTIPNGQYSPHHEHDWGEDAETYYYNCEKHFTVKDFERYERRVFKFLGADGRKLLTRPVRSIMWVRKKEVA